MLGLIRPTGRLQSRQFSSISILLKKRSPHQTKNGKHQQSADSRGSADAGTEANEIEMVDVRKYLSEAKDRFSQTLELHKRRLDEMKQGKANPHVFDELQLPNGTKFTDVATTSMRGKNSLLITVFDPKDTKNIISLILGSGLNMTPERLPNNEQQLKIALPSPTRDARLELCKELKKLSDDFKNSTNFRYSLNSVRRDIMSKIKKLDSKDNEVYKVTKELENIHKEYITKLQEQLKQAENSVLR